MIKRDVDNDGSLIFMMCSNEKKNYFFILNINLDE